MPRVEVLGEEIRQYEGQDVRALVLRVVGQTESARQQKSSSGPRTGKTTEVEFMEYDPVACTVSASEGDMDGFEEFGTMQNYRYS